MNQIKRQYYLFNLLSNGAVQIFSAVSYIYIIDNGFSFIETNLYLSMFWIVCTVSEIPSGLLVDSLGPKKVLSLGYFLRFIGISLLVWLPNFQVLILSAIFTGVAEALQSGTLETWLANVGKEENTDFSIKPIYSRASIFRIAIGMLLGYLGSKLFSGIGMRVPFIVSAIVFFILAILIFNFFKENASNRNKNEHNIKIFINEYVLSAKQAFNYSKKSKNFWLMILILLLPVVNDVGPSNQWQIFINNNSNFFNVGSFFVCISVSGILANIFVTKLNIRKVILFKVMVVLFIVDISIVIMVSLNVIHPFFFLVHVFLLQTLSTLTISVIHDDLITDNSVRGTLISIYNTVEAFVVSLSLMINGYLSDKIGIENSWLVFSIASFLLFIVLVFTKNVKEKINGE